MPETPADYAQFIPDLDAQDDERLVNLAMPRSALKALERDARITRQARAQAAEQPADTPLEPGEANLTRERRALTSAAPPDNMQPGDPYKEGRQIYDEVLAGGGKEVEAFGAAFNSVVGAAAQGDQRTIIDKHSPQAFRGGLNSRD